MADWSEAAPPQPAIKASRPFGADNCQTNKLSSLKRRDGFYFENVDPSSSQAASFLSRCVLLLLFAAVTSWLCLKEVL